MVREIYSKTAAIQVIVMCPDNFGCEFHVVFSAIYTSFIFDPRDGAAFTLVLDVFG